VATGWALYKVAASLQGDAFFKHGIAGGARHSNWLVFGIIVATLAGVVAVAFGIGYSIARAGGRL
jgi:t-SNARE complex subunit (syntaxin)